MVRGGSFVDGALLDELSRLMGAEVAVRDEAGGRWIAPARSPLSTWTDPPAGAATGEVALRGESFRWRAAPLAPGLSLVVAIPRSAIVEVMGGVGRSTVIAAFVALAGALIAASLLSARIAAPVRARFDRMAEELAASRERVLQAERVAAWREMARRLAHELKNPIFPIQLSIETLRRVAEDDPRGRRLGRPVPRVERDHPRRAPRAAEDHRRVQPSSPGCPRRSPAPVDVNEVVEQVLAPVRAARGAGVEVRTDLAGDCPLVAGDRDLLARALGNLVSNALDAMGGDREAHPAHRAARRRHVRIDVEDTGPGLSDEQRTRLFTPYYTTKKGGTGLGLAIVQGIVSDHGGRVEVASAPGQGTAFTLFLPSGAKQG